MQFIKIPKQIIKKYPGTVIKVYGALESHCRKNKTFCYPGNKRLSELTGIKTKATLVTAKDILEKDGWVEIQERKGKSNIYKLMQTNADFKMIPIEALLVSNTTFKLYCVLLYITHNEETETTLKNIKNISGIKEGRTIRKCMLELASKNFVNITRFPTKYITNWKIHKMNVGIFEPLCGNFCTTMWEKLNYYVGIFEPEANYVEIRLIEANFAKQGQAQKILHHRETDIVSDTNPMLINSDIKPDTDDTDIVSDILLDTELNTDTDRAENKESFVAGHDDGIGLDDDIDLNTISADDMWAYVAKLDAAEPPPINRKLLRDGKNKANLSNSEFEKFKEAKNAKFNGDVDIVAEYIEHEIKMWEGSDRIIKGDKRLLLFQKEYYTNHEIFQHFKNMTDDQRAMELKERQHA